MTFVSKLALAAVLTFGTTALTAVPAAAQKNDKAKQDDSLKVSDEFRKAAVVAETAITAKDWAGADTSLAALEAVSKNDDERYYTAGLRLKQEVGRNNSAGISKALTTLIANPRTPEPARRTYTAVYHYELGVNAVNDKKYAEAITNLLKAREYGSSENDISILLANAYGATGKPAESVAEVEKSIAASKAAGRKPPEAWYQFAIPKVNATGDRAAMASWLSRFITEYPTIKNWHWAISVYRSGSPTGANERTERVDLYRLMRVTKSLPARSDYVNYAAATKLYGLPWEAVAVIEEGRTAGKIPTSDAEANALFTSSQAMIKTEGSLEAQAKTATTGKAAAGTGDAFLASGNYARAIALYDSALTKTGANADEVNLHRGIAYQQLGQKEEARAAFGKVQPGPLANIAFLYQTSLDLPPLS